MTLLDFLDSIKDKLVQDAAIAIETRYSRTINAWELDIHEAQCKDNRLELHSQFTKSGRSEVVDVSEVAL